MPADAPDDAPKLTAWIDTDGENDNLHIRVEDGDERVFEDVDAHVAMLVQNEQFARQFQSSALSLLTLYQQAITSESAAADGQEREVEDLEV